MQIDYSNFSLQKRQYAQRFEKLLSEKAKICSFLCEMCALSFLNVIFVWLFSRCYFFNIEKVTKFNYFT